MLSPWRSWIHKARIDDGEQFQPSKKLYNWINQIAFCVEGDGQPSHHASVLWADDLMITLGTLFILLMGFATLQNLRGRLDSSRLVLWALLLAFPYPYIANTLGWMTAELGRQPWLIYGLFHTRDGYSKVVSNGDAIFTLIGFTGLYFVIGLLFLGLAGREIGKGPEEKATVTAVVDQREAVLV